MAPSPTYSFPSSNATELHKPQLLYGFMDASVAHEIDSIDQGLLVFCGTLSKEPIQTHVYISLMTSQVTFARCLIMYSVSHSQLDTTGCHE